MHWTQMILSVIIWNKIVQNTNEQLGTTSKNCIPKIANEDKKVLVELF